jgi:hypothetical protein
MCIFVLAEVRIVRCDPNVLGQQKFMRKLQGIGRA